MSKELSPYSLFLKIFMNLFFYDVEYVKYLKEAEVSSRGFTRVPDIEYLLQ